MLLDIGGGFPGVDGAGTDEGRFSGTHMSFHPPNTTMNESMSIEDSATDIAAVLTPLIDELFPQNKLYPFDIISEPGRYFVEQAFAVCSRIYSIQIIDKTRHYYIAKKNRSSLS